MTPRGTTECPACNYVVPIEDIRTCRRCGMSECIGCMAGDRDDDGDYLCRECLSGEDE